MNHFNPTTVKSTLFTSVLVAYVLLLALIAFLFAACKKAPSDASMSVYMTDAPAPFLNVFVDVQEFKVHYADGKAGVEGWVSMKTNAKVYDLLTLQNDVTAVIANDEHLPEGHINQIRLVLGANNYVITADSIPYPLVIPSGEESGLKINTDVDVTAGSNIALTFDFDAAASIGSQSERGYKLSPVLKVVRIEKKH